MTVASYIVEERTCLASSVGGHYRELLLATAGIEFKDRYFLTFFSEKFDDDEERYFVMHPRKSVWRTLVNTAQSLALLVKHRPKIIISTGADVTVPTLILGKLLFGCTVIFVESAGNVGPTLSGRMVYRFSDLFIVQLESQLAWYPKARVSTGLLL